MTETLEYQTPTSTSDIDWSVFIRLCVMMFIQFFIWGAWYVTAANYLNSSGLQAKSDWILAWTYSASPIAAIVAPVFVGMIADRFFATQKVLSVMHLIGAISIGLAPILAAKIGAVGFFLMILVHSLAYMPTINLTNTISFRNLSNQEKQFPYVRVFGTLGWIAANLVVGRLGAALDERQFYITAGAAFLLAIFSLLLPHTPPPAAGKQARASELLGLDALGLMKDRSFAVFLVGAFLISIPLAVYYAYTALFVQAAGVSPNDLPGKMSLGQGAEIVFMLLLPIFLSVFGFKWTLALGMLAWVTRYGLFAAAAPSGNISLITAGILLHGICYDFFFVTAFIYTDKKSPDSMRGQSQGLLVLATYGLGMLIGAQVSGPIFNSMVGPANAAVAAGLPLYQKFWMIPAGVALVVLFVFIALFKDDGKKIEVAEERGFEVGAPQTRA